MSGVGLKRLSSQIRLIISTTIQKKLSDPRLECLASVTVVSITADMSFADVSFSVMGTESRQEAFMRAVNHAHGVFQSVVAKNLRTRTCPTLRFHLDQSIKKSFKTLELIEKSQAERARREGEKNEYLK